MKGFSWIVAGVLIVSFAWADDQLVLKNGDQLTGKVVTYSAPICLFDTKFGGLVRVPTDEVLGVSIEDPVLVVFDDDQRLGGVLSYESERLVLRSDTLGELVLSAESIRDIRRDYAAQKNKEANVAEPEISYGEEVSEPALDFLRGSTVLLKDGQGEFSLGLRYSRQRFTYPTMFNSDDILNTTSNRLDTVFGYSLGLANNTELWVRVPYVFTNVKDVSSNAFVRSNQINELGDAQVGMQYLIRPQSLDWPSVSWSVRVSVPTGKRLNYEAPEDWKNLGSTGSGHWAATTGLDFTRSVDPIVLFGGVNYSRFTQFKTAGRKVEPGAGLGLYYGLGFAVNERVSLSGRMNFAHYDNVHLDGVEMHGSSSEQLDLGLGLSYRVSRTLTMSPNLTFGLGSEASEPSISVNFAWKL